MLSNITFSPTSMENLINMFGIREWGYELKFHHKESF